MPDTVELGETAPHGKRAGRAFGLAGAFPTAETRDDPGGPGGGPGWGFFCRSVRPSYWSWRAARSSIWPGSKRSRAASDTWSSQARTNRMTRHAVRAVTIASFIRASAVVNWLDSMSKAWLFITQNNCSMFQRRRYQPTICSAASISLTSCVVESRQWMDFSPGGVSYSQTSTVRRVTCGGAARMLAGRMISTSPKRNSSLAVRALRLPNWAFNGSRKR